MVERQAKRAPEQFSREDIEALYWAMIDLLTSNIPIDEKRRTRLKGLVAKLSEHARHLEIQNRTASGLRRKVDLNERRDLIRQKLLLRYPADEKGTWAIFAEGVADEPQHLLLAVVEGTFAEAIERALNEPGFITDGMGGQIDPLGIEPRAE